MSKTNPSPHMGMRAAKRGAVSVVDADRTCIGADERGICSQRAQCKRHIRHEESPSALAMRLPRVTGFMCHYFAEVAQ